ncbi:hypothetical protein [Planctomycetes bacterium K23_9]|uniref:DUF4303 domain-containing protein n=1 Tax=Stieleria marina TaxID=1930275 RepID=A0A517NQE5_9BACT|nr:hypothetical protein K239x_12890 [Planctomycetes bacterium K23_9]
MDRSRGQGVLERGSHNGVARSASFFAERNTLDNTELLAELRSQLRALITSNYADLTQQFGDICGYAICAPPYFEHIFPAYQRASALQKCATDSLGLNAHFPPQWQSIGTQMFDAKFNELTSLISERRCDNESLEATAVFNTILDVLIDVEHDGVFGPRSGERFVTMWDVGGDESMILAASQKLNSATVHASAMETFGVESS